jgi:hypothetical protein
MKVLPSDVGNISIFPSFLHILEKIPFFFFSFLIPHNCLMIVLNLYFASMGNTFLPPSIYLRLNIINKRAQLSIEKCKTTKIWCASCVRHIVKNENNRKKREKNLCVILLHSKVITTKHKEKKRQTNLFYAQNKFTFI